MKNGGVFLGGLALVLTCNLMLIGVCSSAPLRPTPAAAPPPPPPAPIVRIVVKPAEVELEPIPFGLFLWGCGAHSYFDPEAALPLPICAPMPRF